MFRLWKRRVDLFFRTAIASAFICISSGTVFGDEIDGWHDLAFQYALEQWLLDDEKTALPALADLTRNGNSAALFLLALIDKTPELQGPWLSLLPRQERVDLMRAPGAFSGTSWMNSMAGDALADSLMDVWAVRATVETALMLSRIGEDRTTRQALVSLEARQGRGFAAVGDDPHFPKFMRYLIWRETAYGENTNQDAMNAEVSALHPGDPQRIIMNGPVLPSDLEDWLAESEIGQPLQALCQANCALTTKKCLRAGYQAIGGYHSLVMLGSPLVRLVSEARFASSPRGRKTVLRRALLNSQISMPRLERLSTVDACFSKILEEEGQKF